MEHVCVSYHPLSGFISLLSSLNKRARKVYEALKADDEEEVIMYDEDGMVTEGLSSNAFVLMGVIVLSAHLHEILIPCQLISQDTIFTAPTDVVLPGTFRSLVLDVCKENKIAVSAECPQVSLIDRWQSVFITSMSNMLLPHMAPLGS